MNVPVLTTAFVVCRGFLGAHGVESLSHVVARLDEYLNTFSSYWTVSRACEAGLSRRGLEYLAARDPNWGTDAMLRTSLSKESPACVAMAERWLHTNRKEGCTAFAMSIAAAHGDWKWCSGCIRIAGRDARSRLWTMLREKATWRIALDLAAARGHLEVVQWLCANRKEGQAGTALRVAAINGHVAVAEWLYEEVRRQQRRSESTIRNAARAATEAEHADVAELLERKLKRQRVEMEVYPVLTSVLVVCRECLPSCEYLAARDPEWNNGSNIAEHATIKGFLHVMQWIGECYPERTSWKTADGAALRCAAENGHAAVVEWLYWIVCDERRGTSIIRDAAQLALKAGRTKVAKLLERKLKRPREAKTAQPKKKAKRRRRRY
ncbi:Ankyrin repeat-containing domain [Phytophthora cactorum]|nr:Ankyrin repeat-containing domain [Phytophthora cactorum]